MKVVFFLHDSSIYSGANRSAVVLIEKLKIQYKVEEYIILPRRGDLEECLDRKGYKYIVVNNYSWAYKANSLFFDRYIKTAVKKVLNSIALIKLLLFVRKRDFDLIHLNSAYEYVGAVFAHILKKPYVWHLRELVEEDHGRKFWNIKKVSDLFNNASVCIAISNVVYNKYQKIIRRGRLLKIYNGIDIKEYYHPSREIFKDDIIHMAIVGYVNKSKGQDELIEALDRIYVRGNKRWILHVIGKELDNTARHKVEELHLEDNIIFEGYNASMGEYYTNFDIVYMCSKAEGFGRVTIEAMLEGCLVIGANTGATPEIITDGVTGILYNKGNIDHLANKILLALNDRQLAKDIAHNGQEYAYKNFTADMNAAKVYEVYQYILQR